MKLFFDGVPITHEWRYTIWHASGEPECFAKTNSCCHWLHHIRQIFDPVPSTVELVKRQLYVRYSSNFVKEIKNLKLRQNYSL